LMMLLETHLAGAGTGNGVASVRQESVSTPMDGAPVCPRCGVSMVRRTAKRGNRVGQSFYGCVNYPCCRTR
ncbi:MAG: topoisomerase DNA-binding C4 zinc finger domain-containing protein, partial [Caldilineaceae bacterium]|nr:topoisomerase DNA-binding C4 zinc finger domain-containing protein [Caldilineaceae bacterium]